MPVIDANTKQQIKQLVADGQLAEALSLLESAAPGNITAGFHARHSALKKKELQGTISQEDATVECNQIVSDVLEWTDNPESEVESVNPTADSKIDTKTLESIGTHLRTSLKIFYVLAACVILIGVGTIVFLLLIKYNVRWVLTTGGFTAAISIFPFIQIDRKRGRLKVVEILRERPSLTDRDIDKVNFLLFGNKQGSTI